MRFTTIALLCAALLRPVCADVVTKVDGWVLNQPGYKPARLQTDTRSNTLRLDITETTEPFYLIQIAQPLTRPVAEGETLKITFRARSASRNPLRAVIERTGPPYEALAEVRPVLGADWEEFSVSREAVQHYAAGGLSLRLQCGYQTGVIEFASLQVENLGVTPTSLAARAALEPAAIEARIDKIRRNDVTVEVRDAAGKPVPGVSVHIDMTRSAFLFGCNIFMLDPKNGQPWQQDYQRLFTNLLNYATLPFYWSTFEGKQGEPSHDRLTAMARWCRAHGIEPKGHPLVWHETWPKWAPQEPDAAIPLLQARVADLIPRYRGLIDYWDVLNEANNARDFVKTGEGNWIRRDGPAAVVSTALGWAREAVGTNRAVLLYNDFNVSSENEELIAELANRNALPDAIGIQSHMHDHVWPLRRAWQICERFGAFGRPVHFTELTVVSSTNRPKNYDAKRGEWPNTPAGEAAQAEYVGQLYPLLFSHPAVRAITWWDFSDRNAWRNAPSGLIREDMTPKPAYNKLHALLRGAWWTHAAGTTGSSGTYATRAFQGQHRIVATAPDGRSAETTVEVPIDGRAVAVPIVLKQSARR